MKLAKCPCGQTPKELHVQQGEASSWGFAFGKCCSMWAVEFRTIRHDWYSEESYAEAVKAWNEAPRESGWISVKDRLPEYQAYAGSESFAHVFVCVNGCVGQGMYCNGKWEFMGLKNVDVAHWMPLPEPPKEE